MHLDRDPKLGIATTFHEPPPTGHDELRGRARRKAGQSASLYTKRSREAPAISRPGPEPVP